jgi:phosphoglycerate dehydrogenase-like enzyme
MIPPRRLPPRQQQKICFAHAAYALGAAFARRQTGIAFDEVRTRDALRDAATSAHVIVVSGLWSNDLLAAAPGLSLVQSISAGIDQYDQAAFRAAGVRLANASGVNADAVAQHALALTLALARRLPEARDNQQRRAWRGMIGDPQAREQELTGKTLLVVGWGRIGARVGALAKAFGMHVIGLRRSGAADHGADEMHPPGALLAQMARADVVVLTCPLTAQTEGLIGAAALAAMQPGAMLVNVARGRVVDEASLVAALHEGRICAGLDVTIEEPLPAQSPLWGLPNVLITPHTAGETQRYEDNVIDILVENLDRLDRGETALRNGIV